MKAYSMVVTGLDFANAIKDPTFFTSEDTSC
jgi:hypothetical protein